MADDLAQRILALRAAKVKWRVIGELLGMPPSTAQDTINRTVRPPRPCIRCRKLIVTTGPYPYCYDPCKPRWPRKKGHKPKREAA